MRTVTLAQKQAMKEGRRIAKEKRDAAGEKREYLDPVERAKRNPTSLRMAINGKCWECMGAGGDPHTQRSIRECTSPKCPLYPLRPYQKKTEGEEDNEST